MQIVDSHVHFWHPEQRRYAWLDEIPALNRPILPRDYDIATDSIDIAAIVFVQAACKDNQALDEVKWVNTLDERIEGIVAFAPLEKGDAVRDWLDTLSGYARVKGVRRLIQSEELGFAIQPTFIQGVQALADYDFSFDICVYHYQLPDVIDLVQQCPQVNFVLDHGGKPNIKGALFDPWREHIDALAQFDNISCKISGLVTEADHAHWTADNLAPYIDHLLSTFGSQRLMFGSDYPVVNRAGEYERWFNVLQSQLSGLSATQKQDLFYNNARSLYRIDG
ncbi:MAG: amidohydrolase [Anaerolineaceae bacterium]|nr:amidohydrolase [Anaerolineaceae bacterium]